MIGNHKSVLLKEAIDLLHIKPHGIYIDGTFGRGGHTCAILDKLAADGKLIAFDKDPDAHNFALQNFKDKRLMMIHDSFANLSHHLERVGISRVDGVLLDLGVSSPQLDDKTRGFSFRFDSPLDMRMDSSSGISAKELINQIDEIHLANILWEYGEERFAKRIAKAIVAKRHNMQITTTKQLVDIISNAMPFKEKDKNPATRSFQAIRIAVNNELVDLEQILDQIPQFLAIGGIMVVISFHSLEDRIVKNRFNNLAKVENLPKWVMAEPNMPDYMIIAKKVKAGSNEVEKNIRSRSSILRAIKRLK